MTEAEQRLTESATRLQEQSHAAEERQAMLERVREVAIRMRLGRAGRLVAIVVAAQFMFGVDAFIVNVAIPTIASELQASSAQIEAVIASSHQFFGERPRKDDITMVFARIYG